jgi:dephospho-CoA kinase
MIVIGVTGVIGSGKSTVSRILSEIGYPVIDLDSIAHTVLDLNGVVDLIRDSIGSDVLSNGRVDRKKLAEKVFGDEHALSKLESIVHPLIVEKMSEAIERFRLKGEKVVFVDGPLIFETGTEHMFDKIVVVFAEKDQIVRRMRKRGLKKEEVLLRLSRQLPIELKEKMADYVIRNTGSKKELRQEIKRLMTKIREWEVE